MQSSKVSLMANSSGLPFPEAPWESVSDLLGLLPSRESVHLRMEAFQRQVQPWIFPYPPSACLPAEVELLLHCIEQGSDVPLDKLGLIFAALAHGDHEDSCNMKDGLWVITRAGNTVSMRKTYRMLLSFVIYRHSLTYEAVAAALQALQIVSFYSHPTVLGMEALLLVQSCLMNLGEHEDARSLLEKAIRMSEVIGRKYYYKWISVR